MKQFLRFKTFLILVLLAMMGQSAWAETETITFSELGLTNGVQYTTPFKSGDVSVTFAGGQNDGKYYTTGEGIRIYANGTMTIEASGKAITAISLTFSGASYAPSSSDVWSSNGSGGGTSGVDASWSGNSTQIVLTRPSGSGHWRLQSVTVTYDAGSSNLTDNDLALTGDPVALSFDLYNNATAQVINYTTSSMGEVTVADNDYATFVVDQTNKTITVTPTAETPSTQTITVIQAPDETYAAGSVTFTLDVTDSTPIPTHTATFSVNGTTSTQDFEEGEAIVFPTDPAAIEGKQFVGWVTTEISGTTDTAPSFVSSATMGNSDVSYYAVFATITGTLSVVDELDNTLIGSSGSTYSAWTNKTSNSSAVYAGNSAAADNTIQLRSNNNNSGVVTTASGGKVSKVNVDWNTSTNASRVLSIYGKSTAYSSAADLYNTSNQGTLLGELNNGDTELTISGDYEYIGIRSKSGALYLNSITITWAGSGAASEYCTTVQADNRADAELAFSQSSVTLNSNESAQFTAPTLSAATGFDGTVVYSSSNVNVAEVDATTGALQIVGDGTTTITATSAATSSFKAGSASYTLTVFTPLNGIAAFRGLTNGNSGTLQLTNAQVLYVNGNDMFVKDATGAIDFYNTGLQYVAGDVLNGTVNAKYTLYKNMPELTTPITDNNLVVTTNSTVTPDEITTSDAANNVCNLVKLSGVTITASGNNFYADDVQIYDKFQLGYTIEAGKIYDIVGIMVPYNSTFELCPTEAPVENTTAIALPTFDVAEGTVAQGTQVTITSEQGTILTYTTDGEDPLTSSTATTTAANTATVTIDATTTIRVVATDGTTFSAEVSATYTVLDPSLVQATYDFTDATWVADEGYTSAGAVESWAVDNVVIGGDKGAGSNAPAYYSSNGGNLRTYNNCRFAVASTDGTPITSIVMECSGASYAHVTLPTGQPGNFVLNGTTYTWTPNAGENVVLVTFSGDGTSRISTITVTTKSDVTVTEDATISAAGFGTLYTEQPFEVPAGMTAGVINAASAADADGISTLTIDWAYAEGTIVPPATPLLIKGNANTYTYTCKGTTAAAPEANLLHGSAVATTTTGGANDVFYMLSYGKDEKADVLGFFYGAPNGGAFESAAGKCWLAVAASSGIRGFVFGGDDDITTGISAVRTAIANGQAVYDLQGRRVENASRGVYIIGGKKVMVK